MKQGDTLSCSLNWRRLNGPSLKQPLVEVVEQILQKELQAGHTIKVCIGSDSQVKNEGIIFATAIVFRRPGKGAFMLLHRRIYGRQKLSLQHRMLMEAYDSVEVGLALNDLLERYQVEMEIHADVNQQEKFRSNIAFKEIMGYVIGLGWRFVPKPNAFASSRCADRATKTIPKRKIA